MHKGVSIFVNDLSYDYIKENNIVKMMNFYKINQEKHIRNTEVLDKLCQESKGEFQAIRNSLDNIKSVENLSVRMKSIVEENRLRAKNLKTFYKTYQKSVPFIMSVIYPRSKEGN